jgi:branched-chain amino acid transport system substrate-binding protein
MKRREFLKGSVAVAAAGSGPGFPAVLRAQDAVEVGHMTPRTRFLGQLGAYAVMGAQMSVDGANEKGGVLGRKVELITEDTPNPGVAVTKAQKLIERDRANFLIGEISSASGLAISEVSQRSKIVYVNTGWNSDEGRGSRCQRYTFHVEGSNTMCTKTIGRWQQREGKLKGARRYFLTADYAFGRVSSKFLAENGGVNLGNDMVPTNTLDYSSYILKLRTIKPDLVYLNLAGTDPTTFLRGAHRAGRRALCPSQAVRPRGPGSRHHAKTGGGNG